MRSVDGEKIQKHMRLIKLDEQVNMDLLSEELFARFPEWFTGGRTEVVLGRFEDGKPYLIYPAETKVPDVLGVLRAHDPSKKSFNERAREHATGDRDEYASLPEWLTTGSFESVEAHVVFSTVGDVTEEEAVQAVLDAATFEDLKVSVVFAIRAVYALVGVGVRLARFAAILVRYLRGRL